jgi:hypothetical protein
MNTTTAYSLTASLFDAANAVIAMFGGRTMCRRWGSEGFTDFAGMVTIVRRQTGLNRDAA